MGLLRGTAISCDKPFKVWAATLAISVATLATYKVANVAAQTEKGLPPLLSVRTSIIRDEPRDANNGSGSLVRSWWTRRQCATRERMGGLRESKVHVQEIVHPGENDKP